MTSRNVSSDELVREMLEAMELLQKTFVPKR
jgi:hypothetical protein